MFLCSIRSQNTDYKGSGFDRGHMAAAGNHRLAQTHVDQTFFLTNMAPQVEYSLVYITLIYLY